MVSTIDMQQMRYLNLFEKISRVTTRFCFKYNETIFFCVPNSLVSKAVGENGRNARQLSSILGKKIRIIPAPHGIEDIRRFIDNIVYPVTFKNIEVNENEVILSANTQGKASLIGRNKRRFFEMQKIINDFFGKDFRIV